MGRPKGYDREAVLDRATELFWKNGYQGTHLSQLVEATGVNRFSLYNEFGGKEGLFRAALEHYVEGLGELTRILAREPRGLANVRAFHRAQIEMDFQHGCFAMNTVRERHVVPDSVWRVVEAFTSGLSGQLTANLRAAARNGELPPERDPDALARTLAVFDMGLLSFRSMGGTRAEALRQVEEIERLLA